MMFEVAMQHQTGKVPSFLSQAKLFKDSASMSLEEEQQASHAAFQRILHQADAGKHAETYKLHMLSGFALLAAPHLCHLCIHSAIAKGSEQDVPHYYRLQPSSTSL